jgi:hypothetical protein
MVLSRLPSTVDTSDMQSAIDQFFIQHSENIQKEDTGSVQKEEWMVNLEARKICRGTLLCSTVKSRQNKTWKIEETPL